MWYFYFLTFRFIMRGGAGKDIKMIILLILSCIFAVQAKSWSRQVTGLVFILPLYYYPWCSSQILVTSSRQITGILSSYYIIILDVQAKSWSRQVTGILYSYYIIILDVQAKSWSRQVTGLLYILPLYYYPWCSS